MKSVQYTVGGTTAQIGVFEEILPRDPRRCFLHVQNKGVDPVFIYFGSDVLDANELESIKLREGEFFEPFKAPTNKIFVSTSASGATPSDIYFATDSVSTVTSS